MSQGNVVEVFSSVQGEGVLAGVRQTFVRLSGCNLSCRYCDTAHAREPVAQARCEREPGAADWDSLANPLDVGTVLARISSLAKIPGHHSVALTGGEPLVQAEFARQLCASLCGAGHRAYLETNGTLPQALAGVGGHIHFLALDVKLTSATGCEVGDAEREGCLEVAASLPASTMVKMVVTAETDLAELEEWAARVVKRLPNAPLVIQPATPVGEVLPPKAGWLLGAQCAAARWVKDVRVIPQLHKAAGLR